MITDISSFKGCIAIDGINGNTMGTDAITEKLNTFIEIYEDEYLSLLLGTAKYEFISDIESENPQVKWAELLTLLKKDISPIACYIFFHFVRDTNYSITGTGVNTEGKSCYNVCVGAWREMVKRNKIVLELFRNGDYKGVIMNDVLIRPII